MHSFINVIIMYSHNIISYNIQYNVLNYKTLLHNYCYIKLSKHENIKLSKSVTRLLLVMTNLHISLEAVEWRLVQVTFDYLG